METLLELLAECEIPNECFALYRLAIACEKDGEISHDELNSLRKACALHARTLRQSFPFFPLVTVYPGYER